MKKLIVLAAVSLTLAACEHLPSWVPGTGGSGEVKLSGAEEVPPATTSGSGSGSFKIAADGSVSGSVTTTGVKGTMAHIHRGARGQNGPIIIPLTKKGDTYTVPAGAKLNETQMKDFRAGNLYVNVHSERYKGGEVRAQLLP